MRPQVDKSYPVEYSMMYVLGEIFLVFSPALLFIKIMQSWVGEDPIRNFVVIWVANIVILLMVWTGMKIRGKSLKDLGLSVKNYKINELIRLLGLSLLVFIFGICAYLAGPILLDIFTQDKVNADFTRYTYLKNNLSGLLLTLAGVYLVSSFGEEVIYRAFLIERISELTKGTRYNIVLAIILSSVFFGLIHYQWGIMGMVQTGGMGLAMGISYIKLNKRLWILILAHAYMDTILLITLYLASN